MSVEALPVHPRPERRTNPWGRRAADRNWPPGGAALGCRIVELPRITDPRGNLTFVEGSRHVPFEVRRVFYLYDVPGGEARGAHAHRELEQLVIAVSGSFDVVVDDGTDCERFTLNRSYYGLYLPRMIWAHLENFSSGSVSLVLASQEYDEADYYRDYDEFLRAKAAEADPAGAR
ncbi:sugar 3,4-ketoisomerase [Geodermatophilus sp. SYSU D00815]